MTTTAEILKAIEELPLEERKSLTAGLNEVYGEVSEEWRQELTKRAQEIDEGKVELVDGEDFLERLKAV